MDKFSAAYLAIPVFVIPLAIFITGLVKPNLSDDRLTPLVALGLGWVLSVLGLVAIGWGDGVANSAQAFAIIVLAGLVNGASVVGFHSTATALMKPKADTVQGFLQVNDVVGHALPTYQSGVSGWQPHPDEPKGIALDAQSGVKWYRNGEQVGSIDVAPPPPQTGTR